MTLQTAQEPITLARDSIESMTQSEILLMTDGLLQNLTTSQIRDIVGYLMSTNQAPLAN